MRNPLAAGRTTANGFLTLYPCGEAPLAASANYSAGSIVSNAVYVKTDNTERDICITSSAQSDITVDVVGYSLDG